ncbi:hypothetical protein AJ79_07212 [Helicocarpus griseus UAMH5409]|uniref:Extracellular membrane protein CFEM domain-containing protein n=1 Tax=Helicocarpus griseus UAMH5409 TaxID=1447875 RepID=A0A2B7X545_9EURO|nr:hypothetical protein AJ79_07212 [Helicocarpus griseus UAMH5409]
MFSKNLPLLFAVLFTVSAFASIIPESELETLLNESSLCSIIRGNSHASVLKCITDVCQSSPLLDKAGCCDSGGCEWDKSCIPFDSLEEHSSDASAEQGIFCFDPTRKYCQRGIFRTDSSPELGYSLETCTSDPHGIDLRIDLVSHDTASITSQPANDGHTDQLMRRATVHRLSKRANKRGINVGVALAIVAIFFVLMVICCCSRGGKRVAPVAVEPPSQNPPPVYGNNTNIYIMSPPQSPAPQQPGISYPSVAYTYPPGQQPSGAGGPIQTIYIQGPPPPGTQPIPMPSSPGPIPQSHPSFPPEPPPAYHK